MENLHNRRRFLQLAGTGATASIAGCSSLGLNDGQENNEADSGDNDTDTNGEVTDIPESALTAVAQADQEEIQSLRSDLSQQIQDGDLSQQEAQQELQQRQLELRAEATTALESDLEANDELSVEGSIGEAGAVLIDGDADAMRTALNDGTMSALVPGEEFATIQQQQQLQAQMEAQAEGENDSENGSEEAGDNETGSTDDE